MEVGELYHLDPEDHCKDLGIYSVRNTKALQSFSYHDMTLVFKDHWLLG